MAEKSLFWTTNNTGDGLSTGYTSAELFTLFRSWCPSTNLGGVFTGFLNELAASGTSSPVAINTGNGLVYGIPYQNSASVNVTVSTPAVSTRIDRIVLRASWAAQTVRITRVAGTEGAGAPSITQSAGTTWDVPICQVSITTGGVITITDQREFLGNIHNNAITNAMLADMAQSTIRGRAALAGTGDPTDLTPTQVRTIINVADGANAYVHPNHTGDVTSVGDGATTIAADAVTFAKMQNIATDSLIGRDTASTGDPENITLNATLSMTGSGALQRAALTGDVTASAGSNATTIAADAVTNAKMNNMAQNTIKGRITASTGDPEDLTATQVRTIINVESGADVTDSVNIASSIHGVTAKTTPVSADEFALIDSAALNVLKKVTYSDLATALAATLGVSLKTMIVPLYQGDITLTNGVTSKYYSYIDGSKIPSGATVKLIFTATLTSATYSSTLTDYTAAGAFGHTISGNPISATTETLTTGAKSSADLKSTFPSSLRVIEVGIAPTAGTFRLFSAFLLIEW